MFGFSWSEIVIIAVVALVVVGPKDFPRAMRTAARWMRAGQKLAREFQGHVDELVREAELEELRDKVKKAASEPLSAHLESMVDPGRELASALAMPDVLASAPGAEATIHAPTPNAPTLNVTPPNDAPAIESTPPAIGSANDTVAETAIVRHDG